VPGKLTPIAETCQVFFTSLALVDESCYNQTNGQPVFGSVLPRLFLRQKHCLLFDVKPDHIFGFIRTDLKEVTPMPKKDLLTKTIGIVGTILAWFPILAPILFSLAFLVQAGILRFDYLMPAEFFSVALSGGVLLIWAALRAHSRLRLIGWSTGLAAGLLVGGQALAVATGLASGETEPSGFWWALVVASLALYSLALIGIGVGGVLLLRDLFKTDRSPKKN
jgi:hypothetical protein